ncbi:MAG: hypothetical protein ACYC1W_05960 [Gemmatimonadaceae bacterium]
MREYFVSLTGARLKIVKYHEGKVPDRTADGVYFEVTDATGATTRVCVAVGWMTGKLFDLRGDVSTTLEEARIFAALFSILDGHDVRAEVLPNSSPVKLVMLGAEALHDVIQRARASDLELRKYIARRVYDELSRATLYSMVTFDELDYRYTGGGNRDFIRSAQVLESEGYLAIKAVEDSRGPTVVGTGKLIREVERFGAARQDMVSEEEFATSVSAWPVLKSRGSALLSERARYVAASSPDELLSVFRATAPMVEAIVRDLLANRGSQASYPALGPMIADLQSRSIAGPAVITQLNHVLKFARDLATHGQDMPVPVLRIGCEVCFSLAPQLAALFV